MFTRNTMQGNLKYLHKFIRMNYCILYECRGGVGVNDTQKERKNLRSMRGSAEGFLGAQTHRGVKIEHGKQAILLLQDSAQ